MKLPQVMRNINEFNIPQGDFHGYEIMYFGVNLILMLDYRLSFDIELKKFRQKNRSFDNLQKRCRSMEK